MIEGTFLGIGTLRKVTGIISVIGAAIAQGGASRRSMQGDTWMTIGFENCTTKRTSDRLLTN
jgi:hypothetical protein